MRLQLGKSSLAMEVDAGVLGGRVLAALRAERWRTAAESAMRNPSRATGDCLCMPCSVFVALQEASARYTAYRAAISGVPHHMSRHYALPSV